MIYQVIVDISNSEVDKVFDYSSATPIAVGSRVLVPFGHRQIEGFVMGTKTESHRETKDIIKVLDDFTAISPEMIALANHLKTVNLRYIDSLRLFIPSKLRGGRIKVLKKNYLTINRDISVEDMLLSIKANAVAQRGIIARLSEVDGEYESTINSEFNAGATKKLIEMGYIISESIEVGRVPYSINIEKKHIVLTEDQQNAVDTIVNGDKMTHLLHGVTGSGKTEVYMTIIEQMLQSGKTAIMLVPEISLTPQMLGVFRNRFHNQVSLLHSGLSDGERFDEWRRLQRGESKVALGARSAIFAPVQNVGAIIIDEEHDSSYVSESNPRYFTVDVASFRAKYNSAKLILGSATPSVDTYNSAVKGEYNLVKLENRVNKRAMPTIDVVDMRSELRQGNFSIFSKELLRAIESTLADKNQIMIYLNRRGYASFLRCKSCGWVAKCPDCDVSLTYHKEENRLKCHYCGKQFNAIDDCPICGFKGLKEGKVGTEKVVSEIARLFPEARVLRMDNDTTNTKSSYIDILQAFSSGDADILVGTQMIAKGHDFKNVTLVGILDADLSLYFTDYRSNERTFQLITQVAGRAGREQKSGRVVMQTSNPKHFVFDYAKRYDYVGFFEKEINTREVTKFPPFTKIVRILLVSKDDDKVMVATREMYERLNKVRNKYGNAIIRMQPMRAPIKRMQTNYRFQIVIWLNVDIPQEVMDAIYNEARATNKDVSSFVEINPQHMM
ncbi:MAG: primosomal protein N' [Bacillota bacterium]